MIPLSSSLENKDETFDTAREYLETYGFSLGGNWNFHNGLFDISLDKAQKVWLRLPFEVKSGTLDGESEDTDAIIQFQQPFLLKHLYNEGIDHGASPKIVGALFDQFQDPVDKDAHLEQEWVDIGKELLQKVEQKWPH